MASNSIKTVATNSIIYTLSGILMKCFSFFLLPLYTTYLTTNDYGIVNIARNFIVPLSFISSFSLFSAISRFYVTLMDSPEILKRFYGTIVMFVSLSSCLWIIFLIYCKSWLIEYIFTGIDYYPIVFICLITIFFDIHYNIYINVLKSQQRAAKASLIGISYFLITTLTTIVLVVFLNLRANGVLLATLITNIIFFVLFIVDMIRNDQISFQFDYVLLKAALCYSIPIIPHNLSTTLAALISTAIIGKNTSLSLLGIYSIAVQFGNIADTIQTYVDSAYGPWLYQKLETKDLNYKNNIVEASDILSKGIGISLIGLALFSHDYILLFINKSFHDAWIYIPFLVSVYCVKIAYYFYVEVLFFFKDASRKLFIATLSSSFANVYLSYILIPIYDVKGAIMANAIAMFIRVFIVVSMTRLYENIGLKLYVFIKNIILIEIFMFVGLLPSYLFFSDKFYIGNFLYKVFIIIMYIFICCYQYKNRIGYIYDYIHSKVTN